MFLNIVVLLQSTALDFSLNYFQYMFHVYVNLAIDTTFQFDWINDEQITAMNETLRSNT